MPDSDGGFRTTRTGPASGMSGWQVATGRSPVYSGRMQVSYWCAVGHETTLTFAPLREEEIPPTWDCAHCRMTAARRQEAAPTGAAADQLKSHLDYAKERRSPAEAQSVLEEALTKLRARRIL